MSTGNVLFACQQPAKTELENRTDVPVLVRFTAEGPRQEAYQVGYRKNTDIVSGCVLDEPEITAADPKDRPLKSPARAAGKWCVDANKKKNVWIIEYVPAELTEFVNRTEHPVKVVFTPDGATTPITIHVRDKTNADAQFPNGCVTTEPIITADNKNYPLKAPATAIGKWCTNNKTKTQLIIDYKDPTLRIKPKQ